MSVVRATDFSFIKQKAYLVKPCTRLGVRAFFVGETGMNWEAIGVILALCGVFFNFIRFGKWQGVMEQKVANLERDSLNALTKFDAINKSLEKNNQILTEVKVRLELILEEREEDRRQQAGGRKR